MKWFEDYLNSIAGVPKSQVIGDADGGRTPPYSPVGPDNYDFLDTADTDKMDVEPAEPSPQPIPASPTRPTFDDLEASSRSNPSTIEQLLDEAQQKAKAKAIPPPAAASRDPRVRAVAEAPPYSISPKPPSVPKLEPTTFPNPPKPAAQSSAVELPAIFEPAKPQGKLNLFTNRSFPLAATSKPKGPSALPALPSPKPKPGFVKPAVDLKKAPAVPPAKPRESIAKTFAPKPQASVMVFDESTAATTTTTTAVNTAEPEQRFATEEDLKRLPKAAVRVHERVIAQAVKKAATSNMSLTNLSTDTRPIIDVHMNAKVSRLLRQKFVDLYFPIILKHYTGGGVDMKRIDPAVSRLAVRKALEFEQKVLGDCGSDASYRSAANRALAQLQKTGYKEETEDDD